MNTWYGYGYYYSQFGPSRPIGGFAKVYPYTVITPPTEKALTLDELKLYARVDTTADDTILTLIIDAVTAYFEAYTGRVLINTEFQTLRDRFYDYFTLRRSLFQSVSSIKYFVNNTLVTVDPSVYGVTFQKDYSRIYLQTSMSWPVDADLISQPIQIDFVAGFGATAASVPADVKIALMQHSLAMYQNRGDCDGSGCESTLPSQSKVIYQRYRIFDLNPKEFAGGDE